jgi:hypothetical protein
LQRHSLSFKEALGALNIIGRRGVVKGFDVQPVLLIPPASPTV